MEGGGATVLRKEGGLEAVGFLPRRHERGLGGRVVAPGTEPANTRKREAVEA